MQFVHVPGRSLRDAAVALAVALCLATLSVVVVRGLFAVQALPGLAWEVSRNTPPSRYAASMRIPPPEPR